VTIRKLKVILQKKCLVDINFEIKSALALVGQSGSGKSLTLKALLGMLPLSMTSELDYSADFELKDSIGFVPQNPFTALSPLTRIKKQFFIHNRAMELSEIETLFKLVDLNAELMHRHPPELSGGQLQRVVIAIALSTTPKLLLLDEPTTALDPQTRENIINLLTTLQKELDFKMLFVTHDMASAEALCDTIAVIKEGEIVEYGSMKSVLKNPNSVYTKSLIEANFLNREFRK
jgi:ABC-type glutathione transport system ATPase component